MPYNCWCKGCGEPIAKGVRFNAEKKKIGMYFNTPIYEFSMKCRFCDQQFLIKINPETRDYDFVSGVAKKTETPDGVESEPFHKQKEKDYEFHHNSFMMMEHNEEDKRNASKMKPVIESIQNNVLYNAEHSADLNRKARDMLRQQKKEDKKNSLLANHLGLDVHLLPISNTDKEQARNMVRKKKDNSLVKSMIKRSEILNSSVFTSKCSNDKKREIRIALKNGVNYKSFKPLPKKQTASSIHFEIKDKKKK